ISVLLNVPAAAAFRIPYGVAFLGLVVAARVVGVFYDRNRGGSRLGTDALPGPLDRDLNAGEGRGRRLASSDGLVQHAPERLRRRHHVMAEVPPEAAADIAGMVDGESVIPADKFRFPR